MIIAYGDDSSDNTKSRVFAASTVFAKEEDWNNFTQRWKERKRARPFHAADCESDKGDFKRTSHDDNQKLIAANVRLFVNGSLMGAGDRSAHFVQSRGDTMVTVCRFLLFLQVLAVQ
jgi:hypothetical protein